MTLDRSLPIPLWHQLLNILREKARRLPDNARFPTEMDLVKKYRISRFTVNKAIRELVRENRLRRIRGSGTYVCSAEEAPAETSLGNVLIILPKSFPDIVRDGDFIFADLAQGAMDALARRANPLLVPVPPGVEETAFIKKRISDPEVAGVLFFPWRQLESLTDTAKAQAKPFVLLNAKAPSLAGLNRVLADEAGGIARATRHLIDLGHEHLLFVSHGNSLEARNREEGFLGELRAAGLPAVFGSPLVWPEDGSARLREILSSSQPPTGVVASDDETAISLLAALQDEGLRVPQDISVTGFDNAPGSEGSIPPLTTVDKPRYAMGQAAARLLLSQMEHGIALHDDMILPARLLVRASTGAARRAVPASNPARNGVSEPHGSHGGGSGMPTNFTMGGSV